jgi:hypothetical protein
MPTAQSPAATGAIKPSVTYANTQFSSGGVGLRNRGGGAIAISAVVSPVRAAWLYWAVITQNAPTAANEKVTVERILPTASATVTLTGTVVGTGPSPCWLGNRTTVYRAAVPLSVFSASAGGQSAPAAADIGNGLFEIRLEAGASGSTAGADPFISSPLPEMEGASLVVIGTGNGRVALYDMNLAGKMFHANPGLSYQLQLPISATAAQQVLFHNIGADGQAVLESLTADPDISNKVTTINKVAIAGPGALDNDPDWNGTIAGPLPQLWDDTGHDITSAASGTTLTVNISGPAEKSGASDCLVTVANVVAVFPHSTGTK